MSLRFTETLVNSRSLALACFIHLGRRGERLSGVLQPETTRQAVCRGLAELRLFCGIGQFFGSSGVGVSSAPLFDSLGSARRETAWSASIRDYQRDSLYSTPEMQDLEGGDVRTTRLSAVFRHSTMFFKLPALLLDSLRSARVAASAEKECEALSDLTEVKLCGGVRVCQQALCSHHQAVPHSSGQVWELPNPCQFLADEFLELPGAGGHLPEVLHLLGQAPPIGVEGSPPAHEEVAAPQGAGAHHRPPLPDPLVGPASLAQQKGLEHREGVAAQERPDLTEAEG